MPFNEPMVEFDTLLGVTPHMNTHTETHMHSHWPWKEARCFFVVHKQENSRDVSFSYVVSLTLHVSLFGKLRLSFFFHGSEVSASPGSRSVFVQRVAQRKCFITVCGYADISQFAKVTQLFPSTEVLEHIAFREAEGQLLRGGEPTPSLLLNIKQCDHSRCGGEGGRCIRWNRWRSPLIGHSKSFFCTNRISPASITGF